MSKQQSQLSDPPFDEAVEAIRDNYDDSYGARVSFGGDIGRFANRRDLPFPRCAASEAVLQPLLRYRKLAPEDVRDIINRKVDDEDDIENILIAFRRYAATLE